MWGSLKITWVGLLLFSQFALGAAGFVHEMLSHGAERPVFLALCGGLMGLPFALGADLKIRRTSNGNGVSSGKAK